MQVTKSLDQVYIDTANTVAATPVKYNILDSKIAIAKYLDSGSTARNEDQADRDILAAAIAGAAPLPATQTVVSNGQAVTVGGSTYTFTVAGGVITNIVVG